MRISDWSSDFCSSDLLAKVGDIEAISIGFVLLMTYLTSLMLTPADAHTFLVAAIAGLLTFIGVEIVNHILEAPVATTGQVAKAGFGAFLYLEVLDASFSFDGVIGAFALSNNLFIIAIGLGRSEEHTSELQSLMRISYPVFC